MVSSVFSVCSFVVFGDLFDPLLAVALVPALVVITPAFNASGNSKIKIFFFFDLSAFSTRTVGGCHYYAPNCIEVAFLNFGKLKCLYDTRTCWM